MGRQFNQSSGSGLPLLFFDTTKQSYNGVDPNVAGFVDAGQGDGSYLDLDDNDEFKYYDSAGVLLWTVGATDLGKVDVSRYGVHIDGSTMYYIAHNISAPEVQLGSVDMTTGTITLIGSSQAYSPLAFTSTTVINSTTLSGTTLKFYIKDTVATWDTITGVYTGSESLDLPDDQFYVSEINCSGDEGNSITVVGNKGTARIGALLASTPTYSASPVSVVHSFGTDRVYYGAGDGLTFNVDVTEFKDVLTKAVVSMSSVNQPKEYMP